MFTTLMHTLLSVLLLFTTATASCDCALSTYAPLPSASNGPPVSNSTGYRIQAFGGGAYMVTDDLYQAMFLVSCESVIVVDAPPTIGQNMLAGIRTVTHLPISHLVYSHAHADHIGAAYLLAAASPNLTIVAHHLTAMELALAPDPNRPAPTLTFWKNHTLKVCNQTLELAYEGPNHEPGNIFIYAPAPKVLMLVDIVYPGWVPFSNLGESQSIPGFIAAHDQILAYDFAAFVGGHLDRTGTRADVLVQQEYVHDLYANCLEAIRLTAAAPNASNPLSVQTLFPPVEAANPGNAWALFRAYVDTAAAYCANTTNAKWLGRLGAADVYGVSHATVMVESLRIDYGVLGPFGVAAA